jgi:hypothetical protein
VCSTKNVHVCRMGSVDFDSHDNSVMQHRWVKIRIRFIGGGMMGKLLRSGMQSWIIGGLFLLIHIYVCYKIAT